MTRVRRIAAFVPNILDKSPGQRVRIETWAKHLPAFGWAVDFYPFEDPALDRILYRQGHVAAKGRAMARCLARQVGRVLRRPDCDLVFIYREASLVGPEIVERLARRLGKPIVYDFDDPIFLAADSTASGWFGRLKFAGKTDRIIALSNHVIAISDALADHARRFNPRVSVIPNMLDPARFCPGGEREPGPVRLGWSGSHSTAGNLQAIAGPLRRAQDEFGARLVTIGATDVSLPGVEVDLRAWTPATEVAELQRFDIGLLPVVDHPGNRYKFFLKLIQYMAVGLPVIAQRAGANDRVIEDGVNGFVVDGSAQWNERLALLIGDGALRREMGAAARRTVIERYTPDVLMPEVAEVFEAALRASAT